MLIIHEIILFFLKIITLFPLNKYTLYLIWKDSECQFWKMIKMNRITNFHWLSELTFKNVIGSCTEYLQLIFISFLFILRSNPSPIAIHSNIGFLCYLKLNFRIILKATAKVMLLWKFVFRIFSVYGREARAIILKKFVTWKLDLFFWMNKRLSYAYILLHVKAKKMCLNTYNLVISASCFETMI